MLGQKRNDSLFGPGSRTIEAPQSVLEKQEAALEGSPLDEAVQPPFETQAPATAFTDADDLPRRTIATEAAAGQRVHSLFFTPESESKDFSSVLQDVQEYISGKYSTLITDGVGADTKEQIKRYISKYVQDRRIAVRDLSGEQLVDALYTEMAEFGFLTKYIFGSGIEEININSWRDIEVLYSSGQMVKLEEHFDSPDHAINVIRRMLHVSGMVLDNASPAVLGHLSKNIRIAVLKTPLVDEDVGVCASIRIVNPQNMQKEDFVRGGTATGPMLDFLSACLRYGVSVCVAGATGSGKTTVAGWLLTTIPDNKRIFTIENGSRELDLVREKNGRVTNSVIHTITRESENAKQSVDQDMLLDMALRYHPDIKAAPASTDALRIENELALCFNRADINPEYMKTLIMAAAAERYAGLNDPTPAHRRALLRQKLELEPENEETLWELFESAVTHVCIGKGGEISLSQKDQKECAS